MSKPGVAIGCKHSTRHNSRRSRYLPRAVAIFASALLPLIVAIEVHARDYEVERVGQPFVRAVDLAERDGVLWVASKGGGLLRTADAQEIDRIDVSDGLPSAVVRQVEIDGQGRVLAGARGGLAAIDPVTRQVTRFDTVTTEDDSASVATADLVIASEVSARAVFQLSYEDVPLERQASATLWKLEGDVVSRWGMDLGSDAHATAAAYDHIRDCLILAGVSAEGRGVFTPWIARDCPNGPERVAFEGRTPPSTIGIAALAYDADRDVIVMVFVTQSDLDPKSRRFEFFEVGPDAVTRPHCSRVVLSQEVTGIIVEANAALIVSLYGAGLTTLSCLDGTTSDPLLGSELLRWASAIGRDKEGRLLIGTDNGVHRVDVAGRDISSALAEPLRPIWSDAQPTTSRADGAAVLVTSAEGGVLELTRLDNEWLVSRQWTPNRTLPPGVYGPATYAEGGKTILMVGRSRGVYRFENGGWTLIGPLDGLMSASVQSVVENPQGGFWVAFSTTPFSDVSAGLQLWGPESVLEIPLVGSNIWPSGELLNWPDGRVWAPTPMGVVAADPDGRVERLSSNRVVKLFRNDNTGELAAVGSAVERWSGNKFTPLLFRLPAEVRTTGHAVDVVVDNDGYWFLLFSSGRIAVLDPDMTKVTILGPSSGVPPTTSRLLFVPDQNEILLGTRQEGLHRIRFR